MNFNTTVFILWMQNLTILNELIHLAHERHLCMFQLLVSSLPLPLKKRGGIRWKPWKGGLPPAAGAVARANQGATKSWCVCRVRNLLSASASKQLFELLHPKNHRCWCCRSNFWAKQVPGTRSFRRVGESHECSPMEKTGRIRSCHVRTDPEGAKNEINMSSMVQKFNW